MHHKIAGSGAPPIVFVHGFGCSHDDWRAQVDQFSGRHMTVAVDLPGHGVTPAPAEPCSIELFASEVTSLLRKLKLPPAILVGHSMGCRVVLETAAQAPEHVAGIALVDGSQFPPDAAEAFKARFAAGEYKAMVGGMFAQMFTPRSAPAVVAAVVERAQALPEAVGQASFLSLAAYDGERLAAVLERGRWPLLALQTTFTNARRERKTLKAGESTPYLDFVRAKVPGAHVEVLPDVGHFPQIDAPAQTNAVLERFVAGLR